MHIEEITIEGFKSYAQRVIIPQFDPHFNAITGLNGSGKSNILDSICFVLGIQNLSQVRASSLQELIYKQGQAGITKASVSIVFNNTDPSRSPAGYEQYEKITVTRQLAIGGRNKYLINGKLAQQQRVQDLFQSVQLNVNNPHFLIMQGRITKVLNMKPPEILSMLEEAAGTRMYETKRHAALKTMEKKQVKLDEINKILSEDIRPNLERLRTEKADFMKWNEASSSLERLKRFVLAHSYTEFERKKSEGEGVLEQHHSNMVEKEEEVRQVEREVAEKQDEINGLKTEKELQAGGEIKELTELTDKLSKKLVKDTSVYSNKKETADSERASLTQVETSLADLNQEAMDAKLAEATAARDEASKHLEAMAAAIEAAQNEMAGAEAGDGRDESNRSMQERLEDAKNAQTTAEADAQQCDIRAKHLAKQLVEAKKNLAAKESEATAMQRELNKAEESVKRCSSRLQSLRYDATAAAQLEESVVREQAEVNRWREQVDMLSSQLASMNFQYRDPESNFDRSRVKGVVATLVRVNDLSNATALEVAAGGKLYQVVVDTEQTAKALLSKGQLRNRVTIIPLNKVSTRMASDAARQASHRLAGDKAQLALELVGYDEQLSAAMKYVFGNAFICKDAGTAKKLAFNREVYTRCITLEGDDFNPSGLLTGGSRNRSSSLLTRLHELAGAERKLEHHSGQLSAAKAALQAMAADKREHTKWSQELELAQHSLNLLRERINGSESAQLMEAVQKLQQEVDGAKSAADAARSKKAEMVKAAKDLEKEIANFGKERDKHIKAAQAKVKAAKQNMEQAKTKAKKAEQQLQSVIAENEANVQERNALQQQAEALKKTIEAMEVEAEQLAKVVEAAKREYDAAKLRLDEKKHRLKECDAEIEALSKEQGKLVKKRDDLVNERRRMENSLKKVEKEIKDAADEIRRMEHDYTWIAQEKPRFGKAGTEYDWENNNPDDMRQKYHEAEQIVGSMRNKVNRKVMDMFEKAQKDYTDLSDRKKIVEKDKEKIQQVIGELDEKKKETLKVTWESVTEKFGSIFSTLLPGTTAKLEPPEGQSFLEGLEVKVAFGGVWKQSLSELSGGQRSLLALSLVLAMLLYKPAPLYILDEVDAALDLSHTQNIGRMIQLHFPHSQFVVVSLKEGMFNNANVIFRTKFVDGVSTVMRTVSQNRAENNAARKQAAARRALQENVRV